MIELISNNPGYCFLIVIFVLWSIEHCFSSMADAKVEAAKALAKGKCCKCDHKEDDL